MRYDQTDLSEVERHAYVAGDYSTAELAARVIDAEEGIQQAEECAQAEREDRERAEQNLKDMKQDITRFLDALGLELDAAKKVSNRAAIERQIQNIYQAVA